MISTAFPFYNILYNCSTLSNWEIDIAAILLTQVQSLLRFLHAFFFFLFMNYSHMCRFMLQS